MKVLFKNSFFGPDHKLYRKEEEYDVPAEWKGILPKTAIIVKEAKKADVKQADKKETPVKEKEASKENDPKAIAKEQAAEVDKILKGKTK